MSCKPTLRQAPPRWGRQSCGLSWRAAIGLLWLFALALAAVLLPHAADFLTPSCGDAARTAATASDCAWPASWCELLCFFRRDAFPLAFLLLVVLTLPLWRPGLMFLAFRGAARCVRAREGACRELLSFQRRGFATDMTKILGELPPPASLAVGLRGPWGSGKSSVLRAWAEETECCRDIAVVWCDVWENDSELDLHWAFARAILAHPKVLARAVGRYPLRLLPARLRWHRLLPEGFRWRLRAVEKVEMDGLVKPSPLRFQDALAAIVLRATRDVAPGERPLRIVVVLDELDRACAATAQAAMILVRRALELPGLVVVLPFVEEQVRYKVFNPLTAVNLDLRETMLAVLLDDFRRRAKATDDELALLEEGHRWLRSASHEETTGGNTTDSTVCKYDPTRDRRDRDPTRDRPENALAMGLLRHYASLDREDRERVTTLFEEKFVAKSLAPGRLAFADLPELACRGHASGPLWRALWGECEKDGRDECKEAVERMRKELELMQELDSLRLTEGFILDSIAICREQTLTDWLDNDPASPMRRRFLMALALLVAGSRTAATLGRQPRQARMKDRHHGE